MIGNIVKNENAINDEDYSNNHRYHRHHLKVQKYDIESYFNRDSDQDHILVVKLTIKVMTIRLYSYYLDSASFFLFY